MNKNKVWWQPLVVLTVMVLFYTLLYYRDNKYQTPPPYGNSGVITLHEGHLDRRDPVFLIDGWLLTDGTVTDRPTFIGEFSSLQRGNLSVSPHGKARYRLTLRYDGASQIVSVDFPQLSSYYIISLDGTPLDRGTGNGRITFLLTAGDHALTVETSSKAGYYSGMYFPPALGKVGTLRQTDRVQGAAYTMAFLLPLALAVFTFFLWRTGGPLSRWFALMCCFYALYMLRYFVFLFSLPVVPYWFLAQSLALYGMCFCVVRLTVLASGDVSEKVWQRMRVFLLLQPAFLLILCLLIPVLPWAVFVHGRLTDFYYIFTFCATVFIALRKTAARGLESYFTLAGCTVFGAGLITNLFFSNLFEPIRFFWQFEWCGLFLVLLFGAMMVSRSRRILRENDRLTNHLEEQVKKRTVEVTQLLEERKAFFSDMAHDLKAPVFATQSYIQAIRRSSVGVDGELRDYLDRAEERQQEMARRLQGLSAIHALDKIKGECVRVSVQDMLSELYAVYHGEAEVQSVYFSVDPPEQDAFLMAQPEKLDILFENLFYNALRATPRNGSVTVSARVREEKICVVVEDTGCGIPEQELPFIFQRFYVGENNRDTGTGLGLYIVQSIVREMGGAIDVRSSVGEGTKFIMEFHGVF